MQRTLLIFSIAVLLCMIGLAAPAAAWSVRAAAELAAAAAHLREHAGPGGGVLDGRLCARPRHGHQ